MWPFVTRAPEVPSGGKEAAKKTSHLQTKCCCSSIEAVEHSTVRGDTRKKWDNGKIPVKKQFKKYCCGAAMKMYKKQTFSCLYYMDNYIQEELELFQGSA